MRRFDKEKNISKVNLLAEQRYFESKTYIEKYPTSEIIKENENSNRIENLIVTEFDIPLEIINKYKVVSHGDTTHVDLLKIYGIISKLNVSSYPKPTKYDKQHKIFSKWYNMFKEQLTDMEVGYNAGGVLIQRTNI